MKMSKIIANPVTGRAKFTRLSKFSPFLILYKAHFFAPKVLTNYEQIVNILLYTHIIMNKLLTNSKNRR